MIRTFLHWWRQKKLREAHFKTGLAQIFELTDKRLALLPHAANSLKKGLQTSLAYSEVLTDIVLKTPALDLTVNGYYQNKSVKLFFVDQADLLHMLETQNSFVEYSSHASYPDSVHCMMVMQKIENQRIGQTYVNNRIEEKVQTALSFRMHRLVCFASNPNALHELVIDAAFVQICKIAAARISILSSRRQALVLEEAELNLLKAAQNGAIGQTALMAESAHKLKNLSQRIDEVQSELQECAAIDTLEGKLAVLKFVLEHPQDFLIHHHESLFADQFGVLAPAHDDNGLDLELDLFKFGQLEPIERVILPVVLSRQTIQEWRRRLNPEGI